MSRKRILVPVDEMNQSEVNELRNQALSQANTLVTLKREIEDNPEWFKNLGQDASYGDILRAMPEDDFNTLMVLLRMGGMGESQLLSLREARYEVVTGKVGGVF